MVVALRPKDLAVENRTNGRHEFRESPRRMLAALLRQRFEQRLPNRPRQFELDSGP